MSPAPRSPQQGRPVDLASPLPVLGSAGTQEDPHDLKTLHALAAQSAGDPASALQHAAALAGQLPLPGGGDTVTLWSALATFGAADLTVARALEPHLDAHAILEQARLDGVLNESDLPDGTWGVYAAEGPGTRLTATPGSDDHLVMLDGTKPWCSLAGVVDAALVTAWTPKERQLFAVDLRQRGVRVEPAEGWSARGLQAVPSTPVHFEQVPAVPVGPPGWYLSRPGFAWGGIGVAAIWFGATVAVARRLIPTPGGRPPDQVALMHLGELEIALAGVRALLAQVATAVDDHNPDAAHGDDLDAARGSDPRTLALVVRGAVARVVEDVLTRVGRATGPAPLTFDEEHARRVADLTVYVRQDHAERDAAALGGLLAEDAADRPQPTTP